LYFFALSNISEESDIIPSSSQAAHACRYISDIAAHRRRRG
jgi:hypothetical protein